MRFTNMKGSSGNTRMSTSVVLGAGWWCWLEAPVVLPGWGASPVFLQRVEPLKTGKGMLRLSFSRPSTRLPRTNARWCSGSCSGLTDTSSAR